MNDSVSTDSAARVDEPEPMRTDGSTYPPIGSLGAIGDGRSLALLGPDGGVEWYCPLRFDAPPVLWRLLDRARGGVLRVSPAGSDVRTRMRYLPGTAVIEYAWWAAGAEARAQVCMAWPPDADAQEIIWSIEGVQGRMELDVEFSPSPAFGRESVRRSAVAQGGRFVAGQHCFAFTCATGVSMTDHGIASRCAISAGERMGFRLQTTLSPGLDTADLTTADDAAGRVAATIRAWREWSGALRSDLPYADDVVRSAITLKLLIYETSGAVVAAATTSLPEVVGGVRNWDYRYTWLRDASFTLNALYQLGCRREAKRYAKWMCRTTSAHGLPLRVLYGIDSETEFPEFEIAEADGYRGSRPVHIGNAAEHQLQLDTYGELLDCISICEVMGDTEMEDEWPHFQRLIDFAADHWQEADSGIWEVRDFPRHFVYSKVMAWVALDRGIRLAQCFGLPGDVARWTVQAEALRAQVLDQGLAPGRGHFARAYGEAALDSTLLLLPVVGFLDAGDARMQATIEAVLTELTPPDALARGLLFRYPSEAGDGLPGREGAFTLCSFWLVEALALAGRWQEAEEIFGNVLRLRGDLGLFAEEIDPSTGKHLGNVPQAFTHIGLINAALRLAQRTAKGEAVGESTVRSATRSVEAESRPAITVEFARE